MPYSASIKCIETNTITHTSNLPMDSIDVCLKWAHIQGAVGHDVLYMIGNTSAALENSKTGTRALLTITKHK